MRGLNVHVNKHVADCTWHSVLLIYKVAVSMAEIVLSKKKVKGGHKQLNAHTYPGTFSLIK